MTDKRYFEAFGLAPSDGEEFMPPWTQSMGTARRVGPDGQVLFDRVAEVTQERRITTSDGTPATARLRPASSSGDRSFEASAQSHENFIDATGRRDVPYHRRVGPREFRSCRTPSDPPATTPIKRGGDP